MNFQKVKNWFGRRSQFTLGGIIVFLGLVLAVALILTRRPPQRIEREVLAPLVETQTIHYKDIKMNVDGYGTVQPSTEISIVSQVGGKIVWVNDKFRRGGIIRAGQVLVKIEPVDYRLAVRQAKADVALAKVELKTEKAEAEVARMEWEKLYPGKRPESGLVYRKPQLEQKKAALQSARASLEQAQLNLERTEITLPEDVIIVEESADKGQYVTAGQSIGSAYGIKTAEIPVPLQDDKLEWFEVPGIDVPFSKKGSKARITADFAGKKRVWEGYVGRTAGEIDTVNRMISVIIEVPEPFDKTGGSVPLFPGMFTDIVIDGKKVEGVAGIPRRAVHQRNKVWVVENRHLYIKDINIIRTDRDYVYASGGIDDGAEIVMSMLDVVTDGMEVRVENGNTEGNTRKISDANE